MRRGQFSRQSRRIVRNGWDSWDTTIYTDSYALGWVKTFKNLKYLSLHATNPSMPKQISSIFKEALKNSRETLEKLSFTLPNWDYLSDLFKREGVSHPLKFLLDPSYHLTKLSALEISLPLYKGMCDAFKIPSFFIFFSAYLFLKKQNRRWNDGKVPIRYSKYKSRYYETQHL